MRSVERVERVESGREGETVQRRSGVQRCDGHIEMLDGHKET